jgi:hypothetical protein
MAMYPHVATVEPTLKATSTRVALLGVLWREFMARGAERGHSFGDLLAREALSFPRAETRGVCHEGMTVYFQVPNLAEIDGALPTEAVAIPRQSGVFFVVRVTLRAGFDCLGGSTNVNAMRNCLQMPWIAA